MITHLEPDSLECEVKGALGRRITTNNMPANLENSAVATGLEKVSFHSNPKERQCHRMFKLQYNCIIFHAGNEMLKILQARLQQYMNQELPDVQLDLGKAEEPEIKWLTYSGS